ncbi:MAG: alpha/beta hydrolase [Corynebacterium casei]|uniref:alpha/beta hydrolase n=1 Tax=Corynebacterium casei TaxID=160386 RepID=UPI003FB713F4
MSANNLANARGWKAKAALSILTLSGITLGAAAIAGNRYTKQRQKLIEKVAPDLRSQILELPLDLLPSTALLRLLNKASDKDMPTKFDGEGAISDIKGVSPDDGHPFYARKFLPDTPEQGGDEGEPRPAMLWIHGGGHVGGIVNVYDSANARVANELDMVVIAPAYRKAPQHRFPADFDDCYAALRWMQDNAAELGIDPDRIAVCGDSAGGGLAAGIVQRAIDEGHPVAFQGLVYPMLDHRTELKVEAMDDAGGPHARGKFIWTEGLNNEAWKMYLGPDHLDAELPEYASPFYREDFTGMPPTWIGVGSLDLFFDESQEFAERLESAGIDVDFVVYEGAFHGFEHIVPEALTTKKRHADLIEAMRGVLVKTNPGTSG